jgi:quercetin dioxygenase-like cupin family protein
MSDPTPIIRQDNEGEQFWFAGGGIWTIKASSAETGGSLVIFEDRMVRGKTTPLHMHPTFDEALYVLEGEILIHVDGEQHRVGERGLVVAPRGVPHAFLVISDTARLLVTLSPGVGEAFFLSVSDPVTSPDDAARPADIPRLHTAAERSDHIELLGPPPFGEADANAVGVGSGAA